MSPRPVFTQWRSLSSVDANTQEPSELTPVVNRPLHVLRNWHGGRRVNECNRDFSPTILWMYSASFGNERYWGWTARGIVVVNWLAMALVMSTANVLKSVAMSLFAVFRISAVCAFGI
jgi:hypothetical protein